MNRSALMLILALSCVLVATTAFAQVDLGLKAIGADVGMVGPEELDTVLGFGVNADLGSIGQNFRLGMNVDYWRYSDEAVGFDSSLRDIAVSARAKFMFSSSNPLLRPFVGAGLGAHFLNSEVTALGTTVSDSSTELGIDVGGGLGAGLTEQLDFQAQFWYSFIDPTDQFSFKFGVSYWLGS